MYTLIDKGGYKMFKVKLYYIPSWGKGTTLDTVLTLEHLKHIAHVWGMTLDNLMGQVYRIK
jgi:hypothetical protein